MKNENRNQNSPSPYCTGSRLFMARSMLPNPSRPGLKLLQEPSNVLKGEFLTLAQSRVIVRHTPGSNSNGASPASVIASTIGFRKSAKTYEKGSNVKGQ